MYSEQISIFKCMYISARNFLRMCLCRGGGTLVEVLTAALDFLKPGRSCGPQCVGTSGAGSGCRHASSWASSWALPRGDVCWPSWQGSACSHMLSLHCSTRNLPLNRKSSLRHGMKALFEASLLPCLMQNSFCKEMSLGAYACTHPAHGESTHVCVWSSDAVNWLPKIKVNSSQLPSPTR